MLTLLNTFVLSKLRRKTSDDKSIEFRPVLVFKLPPCILIRSDVATLRHTEAAASVKICRAKKKEKEKV